ncbi:MAG: phospholipid carrier-dependent glycosyltransferase, partial [Phycisphaerales bacterium]|nr:phospholipid carrier-dependent glycosyltransferase [Phycisphaerales bacterium]
MIAITTVALFFRLWGIRFGFPHTLTRPDEEIIIPLAVRLWTSDLNPHFFDWPTLYPYFLSGVYAAYFAAGRLTGQFATVADFIAATTAHPVQFHLIDRFTVAVLGTATVPLLYAAARRLFNSEVALVAAALLAVAFLHVRESHFGMTDVPATFMIVLAFAFMAVRPVDSRHQWSVLGAAVLCGLATATKYNALLIAVPLLVLVAKREWDGNRSAARFFAACGLMALGVAFGFCLGT